MSLPAYHEWCAHGEGRWISGAILQVWEIDYLRESGQLPDGPPRLKDPPKDQGAPWNGGPCEPIGDFEDDRAQMEQRLLPPGDPSR
jgi:hypothetical protein